MKMRQQLIATLLAVAELVAANPAQRQEQAPLLGDERCLIETGQGRLRWVTEDEKWRLRREGVQFFDVTADPSYSPVTIQKEVKFPKKIAHNESVHELFEDLNKTRLNTFLEKFTSFHTRYYKSDYGRQSAEWLYSQVNESLTAAKIGEVQYFDHPWGQPSIIARIPGKSNTTVIVGAHQDSINLFLPSVFSAPGADDDASGTGTILEALRVLLKDGSIKKAKNTVEFHWYSAEEGGLLGSQAIFQSYEKQGRDVKAMLQQDMTGYIKGTIDAGKKEAVGVITDFVDPGLTAFLKTIITAYCDIPFVDTLCGYACSDHASANKAGYPSAFITEAEFKDSNHAHIHTSDDLLKYLSLDHMLQHARLTLGMVYELAFHDFS